MSSVNVLNLKMESRNIVTIDLVEQIKKNLNQDNIIQILREHFSPDHYFNYDMMGFNDLSLEEAIENMEVFSGFDLIRDELKILSNGKLLIEPDGIEFRHNDDFEICLILMSIGIQIGGWSKGSYRQWSEDDGEIFKYCVFDYDIDGLIYHSRYEEIEAEIKEDGIDWDREKIVDHENFLSIIEPGWDREKFKDCIEENIDIFFEFLKYYYLGDEIIAEVFENKQKNATTKYLAEIQNSNIEITDLIDNQVKLKYAFERSGLIRGKKDKNGNYKWRVVG